MTERLKISFFSLLFVLSVTGVTVNAQITPSVSAEGHVTAEIIPVFSASETSQLNFGKFSPGPQGGKIVLSPQSTISTIGTIFKGVGSHNAASFLVTGENVLTQKDVLTLTQLLQDQADEGVSKYFDIYIIEVQGKRTPGTGTTFEEQVEAALQNESMVGYINALVDCKVTKVNRDIPEKNTVVSSREFKYSYMLPR